MRKKLTATEKWLQIIEPLAPSFYKMLNSQYDSLAISIACDHYAIEKSRVALRTFIESSDADNLDELLKVEAYVIGSMKKLNITESLFVFTDPTLEAKSIQGTIFSGMLMTLGILTTVGFFMMIAALMLLDVPKENKEPLFMLLGSLGSGWTMILSYFYGSSIVSHKKVNEETPAIPPTDNGLNQSIDKKIERKMKEYGKQNTTTS